MRAIANHVFPLLFLMLLCIEPTTRARSRIPVAKAVDQPIPQHYSLSPERRAKAVAYSHARYVVYFASVAVSTVIYLALWLGRVGVLLGKLAVRVSSRLVGQSFVIGPLFFILVMVLLFPLDYYSDFVLDHRFGVSTESFRAWLSDWTKTLGLIGVAATVLTYVFYAVVRSSPRRWWFYFWLATIPLALSVMFVEPYVIEPLFFRFAPLAKTQPALTGRIEAVFHHAGLRIPEARILEMYASAKTNTLNAYVSGLGTSQRVVVWDTTLQVLGPDETLLVVGHELGHYVLGHVPKEFAIDELALLVLLFAGYQIIVRLTNLAGARTGVEAVGHFSSLPLVMLVAILLAFLSAPFFNGASRYYEHQADQYGLEVTHGIVSDPNAAAVRSFQVMGDLDLADPRPGRFITFWLYSHPPIDDRIRFALSYHPWADGKPMRFVR